MYNNRRAGIRCDTLDEYQNSRSFTWPMYWSIQFGYLEPMGTVRKIGHIMWEVETDSRSGKDHLPAMVNNERDR